MTKSVFWANLRNSTEQDTYIEMNQISKGRWKVTFDLREYVIKTTSTDPLEVLQLGISHHLQQTR